MENNLVGILKTKESFTEKEYKDSNCMSYSIFKDVFDNPNILLKPKEEKKEEWLIFGTMVDLMLTGNAGELDDMIVINDTVPSEQYKKISDYILENNLDPNNLTDDQVEECYIASESKVNWGVPVKRQKILDNCLSYVELIKNNNDKIIVSSALFDEAVRVAHVLTSHRWSKFLFLSSVEQKANNIEIYYQYKIKYLYGGILFKSKIDVLLIDHKTKTIHPFDIKTGSDTPRTFTRSAMYRYKYLYQAALYRTGLECFIKEIPELKDYTVESFRFVYVSRIVPEYPVILNITDDLHFSFMELGMFNGSYHFYSVEKIIRAVRHYLTLMEEGATTLEPYDLYKDNGVIDFLEDTSNIVEMYVDMIQ